MQLARHEPPVVLDAKDGQPILATGSLLMRLAFRIGGVVACLCALNAVPVRAAEADEVQKAVERGVGFLKRIQAADGTWPFAGPRGESAHPVGVSSLVGLALLECDVAPEDPAIMGAARVVRYGVIDVYDTYDLSLAVMFLDRLGDEDDKGLIEAATARLLAGQNANGGWGYTCPRVTSETDLRRLRTFVQKKTNNQGDKQGSEAATPDRSPLPKVANIDTNVQKLNFGDDNSNTQFATLALWIARRHHLKVDRALTAVENRFHKTQNTDGGWGYRPGGGRGRFAGMSSTASMTCAGLLGLAVGYGLSEAALRTDANIKLPASSHKAKVDPNRDPTIRQGLLFLGKALEPGVLASGDDLVPAGPFAGGRRGFRGQGGGGPAGAGRMLLDGGLGSEYYFLWGLERVAMVYGLQAIGKKDWFAIGSRYLLQKQAGDGSWRGSLGETPDTCFALFFLRRANLARDLTATLKGRVRDADIVSLRAKENAREPVKDEMPESATAPKEKPEVAKQSAPIQERPRPKPPEVEQPRADIRQPASTPPAQDKSISPPTISSVRDQLVLATPQDLDALLERVRGSKGSIYTEGLAAAIPKLHGDAKTKACSTLAERLSRMTVATLRDKLQDENAEIRRATALACAMKEQKAFVPDLISMLNDSEPRVIRAAHAALKALTQEDFGPDEGARKAARDRAIEVWREWWAKNGEKH